MTGAEKWSSINVGIDEHWDRRALLGLTFRLLRLAPYRYTTKYKCTRLVENQFENIT